MSLDQIAEEVGYHDFAAAKKALDAHFAERVKKLDETGRNNILHLELERLDGLVAILWPMAEQGDLKAIDTLIKITATRGKLVGLDQMESTQHQAAVMLIGGAQHDYVRALKEYVDE